ncbi:MAG: glycosyltransferase family 39 protein [Chloroflexi bacterium]|nr:glycosyltransferase family 39 protein [Chloroflexota bacterium]
MSDERAADRWATLGLAGALLAAFAGMALTRVPEHVPMYTVSFQGWPRLGFYLVAALCLAWTGTHVAAFRWDDAPAGGAWWRTRGAAWLLGWLGVALALALYNWIQLRRDLADPAGPMLWIASMLMAVVAVAPSLRGDVAGAWRSMVGERRWQWLLLGGILAVGIVVRFANLAGVPMNVQADEGDRAASALNIIDGLAPRSWFDAGWYHINMVYFRLLAGTFGLLGIGVAEGRVLSAVSGTIFLLTVAWIGIRHFNWRLGLIATALAATGAFVLQFSRTIMESGILATLWALSVAGFLEGARTRRAWPYALAGLCGGLSLYTYPSARLWALGAVLTVAALWLHGRGQRWAIARGATIAAIVSLVAVLPFLAHLEREPNRATIRYQETTVLSPLNQTRLEYTRPNMPLPELMAIQVERSLGVFDRYRDGSGFLPTSQPLFPLPLAALLLIGAVYALLRSFADPRAAVLSLWFWLGLSGVILTVETPAAQRAAGLLITLPLLPALLLDEIAGRVPAVARVLGALRRSPAAPSPDGTAITRATAVGLVLMVVVATVWQTNFYFNVYGSMTEPWSYSSDEGRQVAALGEVGPVYSMEVSEHMVISGWVRFMAREARASAIPNPGQQLPVLDMDEPPVNPPGPRSIVHVPKPGDGVSFLLYGANQTAYASLVEALYPGGALLPPVDDRVAYQAPPEAVDRTRGVTVINGAGEPLGTVDTFGVLPAALALPGQVEWRAGIRITRSGRHRFELAAPQAATLLIDGVTVAETSGGPVRQDVELARGLHFVQVKADVQSRADAITLRRSRMLEAGTGTATLRAFEPTATYALMDAPWGLLGRAIPQGESAASPRVRMFLDLTLSAAFMHNIEPLPRPGQIVWRGTLLAPRSGVYRMAFATDAPLRLEIDGQSIAVQQERAETWDKVKEGTPIELTAGPHPIVVTMQMPEGGRTLIRWVWAPPLADGRRDVEGDWAMVPPMVLRPETPVWLGSRP